ncbi:GntR family transcriptional regulator [Phyllobacterium zundukense]|uniref:GntR family transcriptional regulator n=1 Tax=Phyllobacterium zundukense TaxID=1867719 RepID=A0A2N9VT31_9HYPH|nr:GntR family transcriptional regulator [Phyllobacterium zundukense]ATU95437.1 GntR family transcriptional regulator [Phyllobacterium zundukense]PIO42649.1 GntR family transcriptional regulator [Phyllobacterium zundukense]
MPIQKAENQAGGEKPARGHIQENVLRYMRRGLMVGAFLPGQVMSLRKLAAGLGTSPMPVREVLSRLVAANALEETRGGSVRVPRLHPDKLSDLFSVREMLEGMATELAVKKATPELIGELTEINKQLLVAIEKRDILNCLSFNQKFHFTLYEASGSEVLMPLIESMWLQVGPTMYMSLLIPSMPWNASDHKDILVALKEMNATAAKKGIVHDIRTTGEALLSVAGPQGLELPFTQGLELQFDY